MLFQRLSSHQYHPPAPPSLNFKSSTTGWVHGVPSKGLSSHELNTSPVDTTPNGRQRNLYLPKGVLKMVRKELYPSRTTAQYPDLQSNIVKIFSLERISRMSRLLEVNYFGVQIHLFKLHGSKQIMRLLYTLITYTKL